MVYAHLFNEWWLTIYFLLVRPMYKLIFKWITGKCELLRITYAESSQVDRVKRIEYSLRQSRIVDLKKCASDADFDVPDTVERVQTLKYIVPEVHPLFSIKLEDSLLRIRAYNRLIVDVENQRKIKYSTDDNNHEAKLVKLWGLYNPGRSLPSRTGDHWSEVGFQGDDPATDFRGMGILGLDQLTFFIESYPQEALQVLSQSHHPQLGFSFAIVGINMTEMVVSLLNKRKLRSFFYSLDITEPGMEDFHRLYCHVLHGFTQFWISERPRDIMEFGRIRDKFLHKVKDMLKTRNTEPLMVFQPLATLKERNSEQLRS